MCVWISECVGVGSYSMTYSCHALLCQVVSMPWAMGAVLGTCVLEPGGPWGFVPFLMGGKGGRGLFWVC